MKIVVVIMIFGLLVACSDSGSVVARIPEPECLIQQDKFTEILTELVELEGYVESQYVSITKYNKLMVRSGDSLLTTFHVNKATFEKSMEYYGSRQELMKSIYEDVLDELNKEMGELESEVGR